MGDPYYNLFKAIAREDMETVKRLLPTVNKYTTANYRGKREDILSYALSMRSLDIFEYLITQIDIDQKYKDTDITIFGQVASHIFLTESQLRVVLNQTKNINQVCRKNGDTILHIMLKLIHRQDTPEEDIDDYKNKLRIMIEYGADPFILTCHNGFIPIEISVRSVNAIDTLPILLSSDIRKHINIKLIRDAILMVNLKNKYDVIELLLPYINNINETALDNLTVLWYARTQMPHEIDIIELLEMNGALPF